MTEQEQEPRHKAGKGSLWSRSETKLFLVTFAGTVAANVVTVLVVALAVIIDRSPKNSQPVPAGTVVDFVLVVVLGTVVVGAGAVVARKWRPKDEKSWMARSSLVGLIVVLGLVTAVFWLAVLGYAVGVK